MRDVGRARDRVWNRVADALVAAGTMVAAFALYLPTLAPTVATLYDDSLEFPLVAHRLAITHPTGYPLYTLLAALFARGPWVNPAWGVNLLSAAAAAATVALVYLVARALEARRLAALLGAVALAASPVFWSQTSSPPCSGSPCCGRAGPSCRSSPSRASSSSLAARDLSFCPLENTRQRGDGKRSRHGPSWHHTIPARSLRRDRHADAAF
jgi:hypothetical protein